MKLFANGCSFTDGGGLDIHIAKEKEYRHSLCWPSHLAKLLKCGSVVNLATGGGSNQRIFRTTLGWLLEQEEESLGETTAVIQYTDASRFEVYYNPNNNEDLGHLKYWYNVKIGSTTNDSFYDFETSSEITKLTEGKFKLNSPIEDMYQCILFIEAMDSLFRRFKLKEWYFWSHNHDVCFFKDKLKKYLLDNFNFVDTNHTDSIWKFEELGNIEHWNGEIIYDNHPSIKGHEQIANAIHTQIKRIKER